MFTNLWRSLCAAGKRVQKEPKARRGLQSRRCALTVEYLEDRTLLSSNIGVGFGLAEKFGTLFDSSPVTRSDAIASGSAVHSLLADPDMKSTPSLVVTADGGSYYGQPFAASAVALGVNEEWVSGDFTFTYMDSHGNSSSDAPINAGDYTVVAAFTSSDADYEDAQSQPVSFTILPTTPYVYVNSTYGVYTGVPYAADATAYGIYDVLSGNFAFTYSDRNGQTLSSAPDNAGDYTVVAKFTSADPNYSDGQSDPASFAITPATPSVAVIDAGGTYTGQPYAASATASGVDGAAVSGDFTFNYLDGGTGTTTTTAPTAVGSYAVTASFTSADANYTDWQSDYVNFTIDPGTPVIIVTAAGGVYNGQPHTASAIAQSMDGRPVSGDVFLTYTDADGNYLFEAPTDPGSYNVTAYFNSSDDNYLSMSSDPVEFTIAQAMPIVTVKDVGGAYNSLPYAAAATATGSDGKAVAGNFTFTYYTGASASGTGSNKAPTDAGTYTVVANFTSINADYQSAQSTPVTFMIGPGIGLKSSANPSPLSKKVTFTATISPLPTAVEARTATVNFYVDGATKPVTVAVVNGKAMYTPSKPLPEGNHKVKVVYVVNGSLNGASATLTQQMQGFQITLQMKGLTSAQQAVARQAAARWSQIIVGDLSKQVYRGKVVDDLLIDISAGNIDGHSNILGYGGPDAFRFNEPKGSASAGLPYHGHITLDSADLSMMQSRGILFGVILHEMGHVLGIGSIWDQKGLVAGSGPKTRFVGKQATAAYNQIFGTNASGVPLESDTGHWRESTLGNELMTPTVGPGTATPLSRITVGALADMGYVVNMSAADSYHRPSH